MSKIPLLALTGAVIAMAVTACSPQPLRPSAEQVIAAVERTMAESEREADRIKPLIEGGKIPEAEAELATLYRRNAFLAGATRTRIADLLASEGKFGAALALIDRGEAAEPRSDGYRGTRFRLLMGSGQPTQAIEQAAPRPEAASNFVRPGAYMNRALAYIALGRFDEALSDLKAVLAERNDFYKAEAALWVFYASMRRGRPDTEALTEQLARLGERWPAPVLRHVQGQGQVPLERVLAEASERDREASAAGARVARNTCLVQFFGAAAAESRGDRVTAQRLYGQVHGCDPSLSTRWVVGRAMQGS